MTAKSFTFVLALATVPAFGQSPTAKSAPAPQSVSTKMASKTFDTPEAATQALIDAASKNDTTTLRAILGSSAKGILTSGDPKQDEAERQEFAKIATAKHNLVKSSMNTRVMVLLVGDQDWPFPIPLLHDGDHWRFDPQRGSIEVHARRIGANELDAIQACAAYVGIEESYAAKKRSAAGTLVYAEHIADSTVPKEFAAAAGEHPAHPYHGYYFRVLMQQGPNAPGGAHSYVLGKNMIGGFALVAWPAEYNVSGVHTFIVNQDGLVYEKDRGAQTTAPVTSYDPDPSWTPVD
jgi:Protein of unknown function (DUF2950)